MSTGAEFTAVTAPPEPSTEAKPSRRGRGRRSPDPHDLGPRDRRRLLPERPPPSVAEMRRPVDAWSAWDRFGVIAAWAMGVLLCVIASAIVIFMLVKGLQYVSWDQITSRPTAGLTQDQTGGFRDPIIGTIVLTLLGTLIAAPVGVLIAVWLSEFRRPSWLARAVESGIEVVAGTPSIVFAIFGLLVFSQGIFSFLSFTAEGDAVFGRSFLIAGLMISLIALPLVVGATREALQSVPTHVREASYALGKNRLATIRRVLIPGVRSEIATGTTLGMGRIAGDTAIVVILLGGSLQIQQVGEVPVLDLLKGTGSTLTSYVYDYSPVGEGQAPEKAYAAAFVLLVLVVLLNLAVELISRKRSTPWK